MRHLSVVKKDSVIERIDPRLKEMSLFYQEVFGMELGPVPVLKDNPADKEWTLIIPSWLTYAMVLRVTIEIIPFWKRDNIYLPSSIDARYEKRLAKNGTYAIALRAEKNADKEFAKQSADNLIVKNIQGITLLERMVLELWYSWKMTDYLDKRGIVTLCHGSRFLDGQVPVMRFYTAMVNLYAFNSSHATTQLRAREIFLLT